MLPPDYDESVRRVRTSELLLIIGSSLEISPVNMLPGLSKRYIIINNERTAFDNGAYITWHQSAVRALGSVYGELKKHKNEVE